MSLNETVTQILTGNGLVFERTERPGTPHPWWWVRDECPVSKALSQTYRHRETLKAYGCRWSKKRRSWYFIGADLPDEIAALVGPQDNTDDPMTQNETPVPDATATPRYSPRLTGSVTTVRESYQQRVLRRFAEQFQVRSGSHQALPCAACGRDHSPRRSLGVGGSHDFTTHPAILRRAHERRR